MANFFCQEPIFVSFIFPLFDSHLEIFLEIYWKIVDKNGLCVYSEKISVLTSDYYAFFIYFYFNFILKKKQVLQNGKFSRISKAKKHCLLC